MTAILALFGVLIFAPVFGSGVRRVRSGWSGSKISYVAAAPLPFLISAVCIFLLIHIVMTPSEKCGIDACAMGIVASIMCLVMAAALYVVGAVTTAIWLKKTQI